MACSFNLDSEQVGGLKMNEWIKYVKLGEPKINWKEGKTLSKDDPKVIRKNQIYGCFAYCDSLDEVEKMINKVTNVTVQNIKRGIVSGKSCYMVSYREKNTVRQTIYSSDTIEEKIEKTFNNALAGVGTQMVYDYKLRNLRKDIPYMEEI